MPCILNAANEIAVDGFLKESIGFLKMSDLIEDCMEAIPFIPTPAYEDYVNTDDITRKYAKSIIAKYGK